MNPRLLPVLWLAIFFAWLQTGNGLRAEDWKTTNGETYHDVKVVDTKPDAVTILHHDGGALVPLSTLSPDLQKRFHYDPVQAQVAAAARAKDEEESIRALRAEIIQARQEGKTEAASQVAPASTTTTAANDSAGETTSTSETTSGGNGTRYSINDVAIAGHSLQRDLSDPAYHTMEHFWYTSHTLAADPADRNHHSMSEIADSGL